MNERGAAAEKRAAQFLQTQGLVIIETNWHCRFGEIDLIAQHGPTLVFVEVRQRRSARYGGAAASITPAKCARLLAASQHYLASLTTQPPCRFDAVLIEAGQLHWLQNCIEEAY